MHFSSGFFRLALFVLATSGSGKATSFTALGSEGETSSISVGEIPTKPATHIVSYKQMVHWIANTDAELTFVGEPLNPLAPRSRATKFTVVIYCSNRVEDYCMGPCRVYIGGSVCLDTPGTKCISATRDIGFCTGSSCTGTCNSLSSCRTPLANGFCFTPSTESILVGA